MKNFALLFFIISSFSAFGGVNLKNGNFYISYTDVVLPGTGKTLRVTRTYNSKATEIGWFGFGWGGLKISHDRQKALISSGVCSLC